MLELKIYKKYFDAILQLKKPFELSYELIKEGSIVKLVEIVDSEEYIKMFYGALEKMSNLPTRLQHLRDKKVIETGRYIIFKSGECEKIIFDERNYYSFGPRQYDYRKYEFDKECNKAVYISNEGDMYAERIKGFDDFCGDYINKKQTYLIEIAEILEVK